MDSKESDAWGDGRKGTRGRGHEGTQTVLHLQSLPPSRDDE